MVACPISLAFRLLRHGEPEGGRLYRGNLLDDPLSEKGWQQMQASVNGKHWDFIATSPMARCQAFASFTRGRSNFYCKHFFNG
jgi:broad specificity phosphatase PhoE